MNGKNVGRTDGQLSKVDPWSSEYSGEKETEIFDSVINNIPVYMPYASALFNNRAKVIDQKSFKAFNQSGLYRRIC